MTKRRDLSVFISSTSDDLGDARKRLRRYFDSLGVKVFAQDKLERGIVDGVAIEEIVRTVALNICLVGHRFGTLLPADKGRGKGTLGAQSWTQWELEMALDRYVAERNADPHSPQSLMLYVANDQFDNDAKNSRNATQQATFRSNLPKSLNKRFGTKFSRRFSSVADLLVDIEAHCEDEDGLFPQFQARRWERFKELYAEQCRDRFDGKFKHRLSAFGTKARFEQLRLLEDEVLVDTQHLLVPPRDRSGAMPRELSIRGISGAKGNLKFEELRSALLDPSTARKDLIAPAPRPKAQTGLRVVLTSASGIGKTTTMQRLERDINSAGKFSVLFPASRLRETGDDSDANMKLVLDSALKRLEIDWGQLGFAKDPAERAKLDKHAKKYASPGELVRFGLNLEAVAGNLTLLVDALDQIDSVPPAFVRMQSLPLWAKTNVVLAGRPRSIEKWHGDRSNSDLPDIRHWAIVMPLPFDDDQAKGYLGGVRAGKGHEWRYGFVSDNLGPLKYQPRVLLNLRTLDLQSLKRARTASALYHRAISVLISDALTSYRQKRPEHGEVDHLIQVMAALAFESIFEGPGGLRTDSRLAFDLDRQRSAKVSRLKRLAHLYPKGGAEKGFAKDWSTISTMAAVIDNGVFDPDTMLEDSNLLAWSSVTIQHFLAAYWLARHPRPTGRTSADEDEAMWFRHAIFYPYADNGDATEELNRFLSEMPSTIIDYDSWVASAAAWYDPSPVLNGADRIWATEMLARSWRLMHDLAGIEVDDWWDISYQKLSTSKPLHRKGVHPRSQVSPSPHTRDAAKAVLGKFTGDFQRILDHGNPIARVFANEGWQKVPAGEFKMGSPVRNQGMPPRTKGYWIEQIRKAANTKTDAQFRRLAEETSPHAWWSGPYGDREWNAELEWLETKVFRPYRKAFEEGAQDAALERILKRIRGNFRRPDETPKDKQPQKVAAFEFKHVPVTFELFRLFSPGHVKAIAPVLARIQTKDYPGKIGRGPIPASYSPFRWDRPERPAIYITWYDAWAFSQWARWRKGQEGYRCRLPHEPEWEYACKHPSGGTVVEFPFAQKYWWGDKFYRNYESADEEALSTVKAHGVGWPGATRDPCEAEGNGLGLKDTIGNVWEWCANIYDARSEAEVKEDERDTGYSRYLPKEPPTNNAPRSMRGGIWYYKNHISTAASRFRLGPNDADYKTGFRIVRERVHFAK
jgi:formylglycine-generating enzyme required for sulfatase activity